MTRAWYPTTLDDLARFVAAGEITGLEALVAESDDEEAEYVALVQAAEESQALLERAGALPGRRVVVVAETPDPDAAVPLRHVVAVHADAVARPAGADPDDDLGWYATQEIASLLATR